MVTDGGKILWCASFRVVNTDINWMVNSSTLAFIRYANLFVKMGV